MAQHNYKVLQKQGASPREVSQVVNGIMDGKTNNTGEVTLTANQATTTVTDLRAGTETVPVLVPLTANAAAEIGNGTLYVSNRDAESFELTHANNAQTDRDFAYALIG